MITINGKKYRNIQEQVLKNKDDIEELKEEGVHTKSLYIIKLTYDNQEVEEGDDHFYGTLTFLVNKDELDDYTNLTYLNLISCTGYVEVRGVQEPMGVFDFRNSNSGDGYVTLLGLGSIWTLGISGYTDDFVKEVEIV